MVVFLIPTKHTVQFCKVIIECLSKINIHIFKILRKILSLLRNLKSIYTYANIIHKRSCKLVFDSNLFYYEVVYRTPIMIPIMSRNHLLMQEKGLLMYIKRRDDLSMLPSIGVIETSIEHLTPILMFLRV